MPEKQNLNYAYKSLTYPLVTLFVFSQIVMSSLGVNKVILIGHLGRDPDVRIMQNGREMANFSLATSESWVDRASGARTEKTEWHNVVVFNEGLVKIIKTCARKGSKIYLEGSLRTRKWVDQNGNDRYTTEVVLQGFNSFLCLLDSRNAAVAAGDSQGEEVADGLPDDAQAPPIDGIDGDGAPFVDTDMDEIPF